MRSSGGAYYVGLDHLRALAALLVFEWHFIHVNVPFDYTPQIWPFALLAQGHIGVSLFMTLSGYLFAKLLDGKKIIYRNFFWNRFLRLVPLFVLTLAVYGAFFQTETLKDYLAALLVDLVKTRHFPIGAWSVAVEGYFYLALPFLIALAAINRMYLFAVVLAAISLRLVVLGTGVLDIQTVSYWTIFGRIDQFVFGILAFYLRDQLRGHHLLALAVFVGLSFTYYSFTMAGGYYGIYRPIWVIVPTVEGAFLASLVAYYDNTFTFTARGVSGLVAQIGAASFSIYLWHTMFVFDISKYLGGILPLTNFYASAAMGLLVFLAFSPIAWLSYRFFELPFLSLRKRYLKDQADAVNRHLLFT